MQSSSEISQEISDKENVLKKIIGYDYTVEQKILLLQRDILEKQKEKKELEIARSKSNYNIKKLKIEISTLTKSFWASKNSGT